MKLVVVTPHFEPDVAPTGEVVTRLVHELAARGHHIEVLTSLPWYRNHRIEPGYDGRLVRLEDTPWGRIARMNPFATSDKRNLFKRGAAFVGFSSVASVIGARGGPVDAVLAVSPPLTLGAAGYVIARARRASFVFNIQDVYPDVAIELGALKNPLVIDAATRLERFCYARADKVTVLSDELKDNVGAKTDPAKVRVIPNFVDTEWIRPSPIDNGYRDEFGLQGKKVVMYAGNVGLSQSMDMVLDSAMALEYDRDIIFVINGGGAVLEEVARRARGLPNVRLVGMQPAARLPQVLGAADVHLVPLKRGLARSSVPSKVYSILAAGRPLVASVDEGSEVALLVERAKAGFAVAPGDAEALTKAIRRLVDDPDEARRMGEAGRRFVRGWASPAAVAASYEELFKELAATAGARATGH
ncbi:MAG: glycosyltransferase family 4 protein [Actinobacteria bacterium]|nr:glycosyltransferase family 4 protein [Actinomycetota bacterium]